MPTPFLVLLLSLICPAMVFVVGRAIGELAPSISPAGQMVSQLAIFTGAALAIAFIFVRVKRRPFTNGEVLGIAALCLAWTLVLDYSLIRSLIERRSTLGFHAVAGSIALRVGLTAFVLHLAFGVVGSRFASYLARRFHKAR